MTVSSVFGAPQNEDGTGVKYVKGQLGYSQYYESVNMWVPELDLDVTQAYKADSDAPSTLVLTGDPVDVASTPIELSNGWNWISYLPQEAMDIETALLGLPTDDDGNSQGIYLKGQLTYSQYYPNTALGWFPDIALEPTQGYMLNMAEAGSLTYPTGMMARYHGDLLYENKFNPMMVDVDVHDYQYNGSVTAMVSIDGIDVGSDNDQLAVFVGDECRGYVNGLNVPFTDSYIFPLMAYSNLSEEEMSFDYYDSSTGITYKDVSVVTFKEDMIYGDVINAYRIDINTGEANPIATNLGNAYPNPFNPSTTIDYFVGEHGLVNISVYDIKGSLVEELVNGYTESGPGKVTWIANDLSSGVYFIQIKTSNFVDTKKLMLIK